MRIVFVLTLVGCSPWARAPRGQPGLTDTSMDCLVVAGDPNVDLGVLPQVFMPQALRLPIALENVCATAVDLPGVVWTATGDGQESPFSLAAPARWPSGGTLTAFIEVGELPPGEHAWTFSWAGSDVEVAQVRATSAPGVRLGSPTPDITVASMVDCPDLELRLPVTYAGRYEYELDVDITRLGAWEVWTEPPAPWVLSEGGLERAEVVLRLVGPIGGTGAFADVNLINSAGTVATGWQPMPSRGARNEVQVSQLVRGDEPPGWRVPVGMRLHPGSIQVVDRVLEPVDFTWHPDTLEVEIGTPASRMDSIVRVTGRLLCDEPS